MSRARLVFIVCVTWTLIALIATAQVSISAALLPERGVPPVGVSLMLRYALINFLPWISSTLPAIALGSRFPVTTHAWRRHLPVHIVAAISLGILANGLGILGFWWTNGTVGGVVALARGAVVWTTARLYLAVLVYALAVGITQTVRYVQRARGREIELARVEAQLARAQVHALTAQIRPHFLFNTLHTIGQLWRSGRSDDADMMLDHLGTLFHRVLASTSLITIGLSEELAIVRDYLAIEQARYHDRLRTKVSVDDSVLDWPVPPLILQPIIENAVRHGAAARADAGCISVRAECAGARLRVVVRDDGPGAGGEKDGSGSGLGLRNTRERLAQMYGNTAEFRVDSTRGAGTEVTLLIPSREDGAVR